MEHDGTSTTDDTLKSEEELEVVGHASLPIRVPSLANLTNQELGALRGKIHTVARKARKDASKIICKDTGLKNLWLQTLSSSDNQESLARFETALMRNPDAFIAHSWANSLVSLGQALQTEMFSRAKIKPKR